MAAGPALRRTVPRLCIAFGLLDALCLAAPFLIGLVGQPIDGLTYLAAFSELAALTLLPLLWLASWIASFFLIGRKAAFLAVSGAPILVVGYIWTHFSLH